MRTVDLKDAARLNGIEQTVVLRLLHDDAYSVTR